MDFTLVDPIARAILYEGYSLYPYRASSLKNCEPCAFGSLFPRAYCAANSETESWSIQTETLLRGDGQTTIQGIVRFLQPSGIDGRTATEREVFLPQHRLLDLVRQSARTSFSFDDRDLTSLQGCIDLAAAPAGDSVFKVNLSIANETPFEQLDRATMFSTQAVLGVCGGRFLSLIDPPSEVRAIAESCRNRGAWPVLVGDRNRQDMILAAPIILYDFPQIAPQSLGNLFDGTEIDEILTLRILTLTDAEKEAMQADELTRDLLERTRKLPEHQLLALHGVLRHTEQGRMTPGDRVRLHPQGCTDIFDLALGGKTATIESVEQDLEGRVFYAVTLDDDPGRDLGRDGKPGHRFFFRAEDLQALVGDSQ